MKKLRFGDLVRSSGRPEVVTLWSEPGKDRAFTWAIKENRVLTVTLEPGKRDFGVVGFKKGPGALFLVFPRPLPNDHSARVIGIHYELLEQPELEVKRKPVKPKSAAVRV